MKQIPINELADARFDAYKNFEVCYALSQELQTLKNKRPNILSLEGEKGAERLEKAITDTANELTKAQNKGISQNTANRKIIIEAIAKLWTPSGDDISGTNSGDYNLLLSELITEPEQLEEIARKHDNIVFKIAIEKYAEKKQWLENPNYNFKFINKHDLILNYCMDIMSALEKCAIGTAYTAQQFLFTENEFGRIASECGIIAEFSEDGGNTALNSKMADVNLF